MDDPVDILISMEERLSVAEALHNASLFARKIALGLAKMSMRLEETSIALKKYNEQKENGSE